MIAYDISDDNTRKIVYDHLSNHGMRVQFSVFECRLEKPQQQSLHSLLNELIESSDKIRWYPLCHWCETGIDYQGDGKPTDHNDFYLC